MKKYNCNIIISGPATGKTYLAQNDDRFIDIDGLKAEYKYGLHNQSYEEKEKGKLNRGEVLKHDSSRYAIELLKQTIRDNKIALISYNNKVIEYIHENKIKYCLVYANKDLANEYKERMKKRGNNDKFIEQMTNEKSWEEFYNNNLFDENPTYKIELQKGQYLSDIKEWFI